MTERPLPTSVPVTIALRGLKKRFGNNVVLGGVDLDILQGETHVILGRSGTGKSVMLKLICGLLEADGGQITIDGQPMLGGGRETAVARHVARGEIQMLFQGAALFDSMTVAQNIAFHSLEHGQIKPGEIDQFARPFLEMVNLPGAGHLTPTELSGGMKKRAALARALAASPRIMLYDEPTTGLDPLTSGVINKLIRETQRRLGVTSLVVTHDLRSAQEVGDRCSFLEDGHILETTTPALLGKSTHPLVQEFSAMAAVQF